MNGQQIIKLFNTSGIPILRDVYECSPYDLADGLMPLNTARKYTRLATVFFGPADSPKVKRDRVALHLWRIGRAEENIGKPGVFACSVQWH